MEHDVRYLHHVGLVVRDMATALDRYRRMGFVVPPPTYPTMPQAVGAEPEPFGVANAHAAFARNFIELVTPVRGEARESIPGDAKLVAVHAPPERLRALRAAIEDTAANISVCLERFPGLHILMLGTADADASAERLDAEGIRHGTVNAVQRPVETTDGVTTVPVRYLEIDSDDLNVEPGRLEEGRLGVAEDPPVDHVDGTRLLDHPNGAIDLVESVLCVAADQIANAERRYTRYIGRSARHDGDVRCFELDGSRMTLVADTDLEKILPGERPPALPAFVAYGVAVRNLGAARTHLLANELPVVDTSPDSFFVPADAALGGRSCFALPASRW